MGTDDFIAEHDLRGIRLLVFDVDGVLTDGGIYIDDHGIESKRFHVRDGLAMKLAMSMGYQIGVITGRSRRGVTLRMRELGIELYMSGVHDKAAALKAMCSRAGVGVEHAAFVGDDLIDVPAMRVCGYAIAVADAVQEARQSAKYVTLAPGGHAAAREAIEHVIKGQGRWPEALKEMGL
jgi:3-deoxy-D-manno-octulosonate 8-phosphate phosphatase (KDO 8-P phosphatase)